MHKKIILAVATFVLAIGAYLVLSSGDRDVKERQASDPTEAVKEFVTRKDDSNTYKVQGGDVRLQKGDHTIARIYDDITGELKYQFEAKKWNPVSESVFELEDLLIQIFMPSGEITYVSCDDAEVTHARKSGNRLDIRRGWLRGNVKITIDRTTAEWRKANPDLADRWAHPEDLINIDMEEAQFDLDQAELKSKGALLVDSSDARIEDVRGLTLQWDQVNNKIDVLRFEHGGKMTLRRGGGMIDFALPGTSRDADEGAQGGDGAKSSGPILPSKGAVIANAANASSPVGKEDVRAMAMQPMKIETPSADVAAEQIRLEGGVVTTNRPRSIVGLKDDSQDPLRDEKKYELRGSEELAGTVERVKSEAKGDATSSPAEQSDDELAQMKRRKRVHTYHAVFENEVVVEQKDGLRTLGRIDADRLEINFDFGEKQRSMTRPRSNDGKRDAAVAKKEEKKTKRESPLSAEERDRTKVTLTWNGPLEMRPMQVALSEQTGERFDAIATGSCVSVCSNDFTENSSKQQAEAICKQLVYRHERGQVWLRGSDEEPVRLTVDQEKEKKLQRLRGREIFFDQKRGIAVVDGPGLMADDPKADTLLEDAQAAAVGVGLKVAAGLGLKVDPRWWLKVKAGEKDKRKEATQIRWSRGVDLELGRKTVMVVDPNTKLRVAKSKEFLKRAWFHGDASVRRGEQYAAADELAVTFGSDEGQSGGGGLTSENDLFIRHLNMDGNVELRGESERISAQRLDVEMDTSGRNQPRVIDGEGDVRIVQENREFRAQKMHVVMAEILGGKPADKPAKDTALIGGGDSRLGIDSVDARGDVYIRDDESNLLIRDAESLVALMRNGDELIRANIMSSREDKFALARHQGFEVHGHNIAINMDQKAIDVPGPGQLWMRTDKDFGGRKLDHSTLVKTSWTQRMEFRLADNYGLFYGDVHSVSGEPQDETPTQERLGEMLAWDAAEFVGVMCARRIHPVIGDVLTARAVKGVSEYVNIVRDSQGDTQRFTLDCSELTVQFDQMPAPPIRADADKPSLLASVGQTVGLIEPRRKTGTQSLAAGRKRPSVIIADGSAVVISSTYADGGGSTPGRLSNRLMIHGDQISVDLLREHMWVPGKGDLLIEDYQFELAGGQKLAQATVNQGPLMSSMRSDGASQTSVSWQNGMDYFVDRSLVSFDQNVYMKHVSGQQMVMKEDIAESAGVDVKALQRLGEGRLATLECGTLILEFLQGDDSNSSGMPAARATDLRRLIADDAVVLKDGTKSLMGEYLQYLNETHEVRLEGSEGLEARIIDQDEATQRLTMWRGPLLIWNRVTNQIEAPKAKIESSRQ